MLYLSTDGNINGAQKLSNLYGNFGAFYTLLSGDRFGMSVVSLGDVDKDGVADLAVGAYNDDNGGTNAGAVYIIFIETNENVKGSQKLSMLYGGLSSFYTIGGGDLFGNSVAALGDVDGDGVVDLAAGARADDDGGTDAGTAYIFFLQSDGKVKNAQKLSAQYGSFSSFYTLDAGDQFGNSIAALGDINNDGVIDLAVGLLSDDDGSSGAGAFYVINLEQSFCETSSPTALPVPSPSAIPAPDPTLHPSSSPSVGSCYHHTSTVTRLNTNGQQIVQVQLAELGIGDRVLALDQHAKPVFTEVEALPHGPSAEPFIHIIMAGKWNCDLKTTLHHTFDACVSNQNPFKHAVEQFGSITIEARNIKPGDCLHTADGKRIVHSAKRVEVKVGDITYSIKLVGNVFTVAVGGVFTHAIGHPQLLSHSIHSKEMHVKKKESVVRTKINRGNFYLPPTT
jgi:hypothetical protein